MGSDQKDTVSKLDSLSLNGKFNSASGVDRDTVYSNIEYEDVLKAIFSQEKLRILHLADGHHYDFGVQYLVRGPELIELMEQNGFDKFLIEQHPKDLEYSYTVIDKYEYQNELIEDEVEFFRSAYWYADDEQREAILSEFYSTLPLREGIESREENINKFMVELVNELQLIKTRESNIAVIGIDHETNQQKSAIEEKPNAEQYDRWLARFAYDNVIAAKLDSIIDKTTSKVAIAYGASHQFDPKSNEHEPHAIQRIEVFPDKASHTNRQTRIARLLESEMAPINWNDTNDKTCIGQYFEKEKVFILNKDAPIELRDKLDRIVDSLSKLNIESTLDTLGHNPK